MSIENGFISFSVIKIKTLVNTDWEAPSKLIGAVCWGHLVLVTFKEWEKQYDSY